MNDAVQGQIDTLRDSVSHTWKLNAILSGGYITIAAGGTADLPSGWPNSGRVHIEGYSSSGIRFSYLGISGNIYVMAPSTTTTIGYLSFNMSTGKITNNTDSTINIVQIHTVTIN